MEIVIERAISKIVNDSQDDERLGLKDTLTKNNSKLFNQVIII